MDKTTGRFAAGKRGEKVLWKYIVSLVILIVYLLPIYVLVVMSPERKNRFLQQACDSRLFVSG